MNTTLCMFQDPHVETWKHKCKWSLNTLYFPYEGILIPIKLKVEHNKRLSTTTSNKIGW